MRHAGSLGRGDLADLLVRQYQRGGTSFWTLFENLLQCSGPAPSGVIRRVSGADLTAPEPFALLVPASKIGFLVFVAGTVLVRLHGTLLDLELCHYWYRKLYNTHATAHI